MVPEAGVEPAWVYTQGILSPLVSLFTATNYNTEYITTTRIEGAHFSVYGFEFLLAASSRLIPNIRSGPVLIHRPGKLRMVSEQGIAEVLISWNEGGEHAEITHVSDGVRVGPWP